MKKSTIVIILVIIFAFICGIANAQIHIKNNQTFHLGIGNDGVEVEMSRNLYIRAGLGIDKAMGTFGLNISDSYDDQWVNHIAVRAGKLYSEPTGVFGIEYGVDKKLTEKLFIGSRVYNDLIAKNTGNQSKFGWGIRLGFKL